MDVGESGCDAGVEVRLATGVEAWIVEVDPCDGGIVLLHQTMCFWGLEPRSLMENGKI